MSDNRPARYVDDDGRIVYRASSLGLCDRIFIAQAQGYEAKAKPQWFQDILDEGTANEQVIRELWQEQSTYPVIAVGKVLEMQILDNVWLRGSIDGLIWDKGTVEDAKDLFEAKKIRDSGWAAYLRQGVEWQQNYPMQTSAYMHMLEELYGHPFGMHFVGGHYEEQAAGQWAITEVHDHYYDTPPISLKAIKLRIIKLEKLIRDAEVVGDAPCMQRTYPCPFYYLHDEGDLNEPPVRPSDDIVAPLVTEWDHLEAEIKERAATIKWVETAKKRQKELQEGIRAWLEASGQESGDVSQVKVGDSTVALKFLVSPRKEYTVPAGEQTRVTVRIMEKDGQETGAKMPKVSAKKVTNAGKKLAPRKGK